MYKDFLGAASDWATILTALVATFAYGRYWIAQTRRRNALEAYLRTVKINADDEGRRTVMHLMANLAMTEAEVIQAGFQSKCVKAVPGTDQWGRAMLLYFEYEGADIPAPAKF